MMVESIRELRRKVQEPVMRYNDIAGILFGNRVSIHITRLFVAAGLGPTVASMLMLASGLVGSVLLVFGDRAAVVGFALMIVYYVFDCVDGEVARYHRGEKIIWSFHDYMFHLYVKSAFYLCLGIGLYRSTGHVWLLAFAWIALLASLFRKAMGDLAGVLPVRLILARQGDEVTGRLERQVLEGLDPGGKETAEEPEGREGRDEARIASYGGPLGILREVATNFDLFMFAFLGAAVADLFVAPFELLGGPWNLKATLLVFVALTLVFDFLDRLWHTIRAGRFLEEARSFLVAAHRYRIRKGGPNG
jgi:hypothetical protein